MCMFHQIDAQKAEMFGDKLMGVLNNGSLSLMISIGHRTGLFDAMSKMNAATSDVQKNLDHDFQNYYYIATKR
jgi:hypothetical protein